MEAWGVRVRLADLHPEFYTWHGDTARIGIIFDCPVHRNTPQAHRCFVPFRNPLDGGRPEQRNHLWQREGETIDTLSLSPSVDYTRLDNGQVRDPSCWHGFITNGEVT